MPWAKLRKDENDNVLGVLGEAFKLRDKEKALSATWLEYFSGARDTQITSAVQTIRASIRTGGKSGFAIGKVAAINAICVNRHSKIRIVYEPMCSNKAHVGVRDLPRDDLELLEMLAAEAWSELILNSQVVSRNTPAS